MDILSDHQLLRYSKQILLDNLGLEGQAKILNTHVLLIGVGGLGCPVLTYLTSAGVGEITLIDYDIVDLTNLNRQFVFNEKDVGSSKVMVASKRMKLQNPELKINILDKKITIYNLKKVVKSCDIIIDATDNFESRYAINQCCVEENKICVSGTANQFEGSLISFNHNILDMPCYQCLYPEVDNKQMSCVQNGILGAVVGIIGLYMVLEVIKIITSFSKAAYGVLMLFDSRSLVWKKYKVNKDHNCLICKKLDYK